MAPPMGSLQIHRDMGHPPKIEDRRSKIED